MKRSALFRRLPDNALTGSVSPKKPETDHFSILTFTGKRVAIREKKWYNRKVYENREKVCFCGREPDREMGDKMMISLWRNSWKRAVALLLALLMLPVLSGAEDAGEQGETPYQVNEWNFLETSMDISGGIPENASGVLARIRERGAVRVATEPFFPPQEFIDPDLDGQETYAGADMKLARLIAERMGVELEIVPLDFTDVFIAVQEGTCDLAISAIAYTPGRAYSLTLSKGYYYTAGVASTGVMIRKEDAETLTSLDALADKTLTAQRGSLQESLGADNVRLYQEFIRVESAMDTYQLLMEKKADAAFVDIETAEAFIEHNPDCGLQMMPGVFFALEEQYQGDRIAGKTGELELIAFVNGVLDEVLEKGLYLAWIAEAQQRASELGM